jgi:hypothetical protein
MEKTAILQDAYNYISNSSEVFNVCLVKQLIDGEVIPKYISFQMWLDTSVVMFKLYVNDDLETYSLMSDNLVVIKKVKLDKLFSKIHKLDLVLGDSDITGTKKILDL